MPPHVIDVLVFRPAFRPLSSYRLPPNLLHHLIWSVFPGSGSPLSRETPKPPPPHPRFGFAYGSLSSLPPPFWVPSPVFCISGFPGSSLIIICGDSSPTIPPFSGYILPRDFFCPTVCHDPFRSLFCLSPSRPSIVNPSFLPSLLLFPLYQHPLYNTHHLLLFSSFSISTRYQELEKAHSILSRLWYAGPLPQILPPPPSRPYRRTFPRWLIMRLVSHFLVSSFLSF